MAEEDENVLLGRLHQLRVKRSTQGGVQHHPQQRAAPRPVAAIGQQRIVGENRSHPRHDRIRGMAHAVHFAARRFARDPIRAAAGALRGRNAPIERSGNLHGYERQRRGDVPGEAIVEPAGRLLQHAHPHLDPAGAQPGNARATQPADWDPRSPPPPWPRLRLTTHPRRVRFVRGGCRVRASHRRLRRAPDGPACLRATISA